ncbi:MAG: PQQ-binding-like beta-propeller repeat protein [Tannerellaceae bacterium]|nr:PQQ-binding-like beta-propeller repeat protein [Tannerellaceae bacterium]
MKLSVPTTTCTFLTGILLCVIQVEVSAQTPHGWRGPDRNRTYPETGLLKEWPAEGPELLWETLDAGKGYSSPVIVDGKLYLTGMNEDETREIFSAYTLDGKKLYETVYGSPWKDTYPETRITPAIESNKAYVISGSGEIVCINTKNGEIIWAVDGGTLFERKTRTWGTSECPLLFDNKLIYTPGGDQTMMIALNPQNGEVIWKSPALGEHGSYVSPLLINHNGKKQIIAAGGEHVFGVNTENGNIEWKFEDWGKKQGEKIAPNTPIYKDGKLFFSFGYNMGSFQLQLNNEATDCAVTWRNDDFDTHIGGYVLVDGILYGSNWINNNQGNWIAVDWETGETKYDTAWSRGKSKGSIITADGRLYCYDERRGAVGLVNPTPEKFDVISEFRITKGEGPHWAHPVINNGVLYMRHGTALMAYKIKE